MAAGQPLEREPAAGQRAMALNGFHGIPRTGGLKTALAQRAKD
jgi:hypothetical protein